MSTFEYYTYDKNKLFNSIEEDIIKSECSWLDKHLSEIKSISYLTLDENYTKEFFVNLFPEDHNQDTLINAIESNLEDVFNNNFSLDGDGNTDNIDDYYIRPCFICKEVVTKAGEPHYEIIGVVSEPIEIVSTLLQHVVRKAQDFKTPSTAENVIAAKPTPVPIDKVDQIMHPTLSGYIALEEATAELAPIKSSAIQKPEPSAVKNEPEEKPKTPSKSGYQSRLRIFPERKRVSSSV